MKYLAPIRDGLLLATLLVLSACSGKPDHGPEKIRWDGDSCQRCAMAISDPHYAAEIRGAPAGSKTRIYKFDDIGCAVVWLDKQPWKNDPRTEVWVRDYQKKRWLDARSAWYIPGQHTPMDYQLGATSEQQDKALDWAAARKHIYAIEQRDNPHAGEPLAPSPGTKP